MYIVLFVVSLRKRNTRPSNCWSQGWRRLANVSQMAGLLVRTDLDERRSTSAYAVSASAILPSPLQA